MQWQSKYMITESEMEMLRAQMKAILCGRLGIVPVAARSSNFWRITSL